MQVGVELWNRASLGDATEWERVQALGGGCMKMRPYPDADTPQGRYSAAAMVDVAVARGCRLLLLRRGADGLINPGEQLREATPVIARARALGLRVIYILSNEDSHPASPYRQLSIERYRQDLSELVLTFMTAFPDVPLASPPMAVYADDLEWLEALEPDFQQWGLEYRCAHLYWQYDNHASPDWGRRLEQYAAISPGVSWLVDELGDATPDGEKPAADRAAADLDVLLYLQGRGDVEAATLFLAAGGTTEWGRYVLPAEELAGIRRGLESGGESTTVNMATIGNGYRIRDRRGELRTNGAYARRDLALVKRIAIHHTGVAGDMTAEAIADYHVKTNGWPGAGYHVLVHPDGSAELLNDLERTCFNVAYRNAEVIGVALAGDFSQGIPTDAALATTRRIVAELQYTLGWFCLAAGHYEIADPRSPTSCPGTTFARWKAQVQVLPPSEPEAKPAYRYVLGFAELAQRLGADVVGVAMGGERRASVMLQRTDRGLMLYEEGAQPAFFRDVPNSD